MSVCCKMALGENEELAKADPEKFYRPAYIGPRGWIALRLDLSRIDWKEVSELVAGSYRLVAPKKLAELYRGRPPRMMLWTGSAPPDLALADHHSACANTRREALWLNSSGRGDVPSRSCPAAHLPR